MLRENDGSSPDGLLVVAVEGFEIANWANSLIGYQPAELRWQRGETISYTIEADGITQHVPIQLTSYPLWQAFIADWGTIVYGVTFLLIGIYVFIRRPDNRAGQILFLASACVIAQTAWSFGLVLQDIMDGTGYWLYLVCAFFFYNLNWIALLHFSIMFPQPIPLLRRRWLVPAMYIVPMLLLIIEKVVSYLQAENILGWLSSTSILESIHPPVFLLLSMVAVIWQVRNSNSTKERQQIRWLLFASLIMGGATFLLYILPGALGLNQISPNGLGLVIIPFPVAIGIAVLRHNIFDIDTVLNRALVYGTLTVGTMLLYVLVVGFLADLFNLQDRTLIAFLTTGVVAVLFQPLRERLQRWVNCFLYGERDDPYTVLSRLGRSLENTYAAEDVISTIVETIATTLMLPYVAIQLDQQAQIFQGELPKKVDPITFPLRYRNIVFGELIVSPRSEDEPFTTAEKKLLVDLSRQIETAVRNVHLAADLQLARRRLLTTREEERRRIRRDLHDGLGPTLASQILMLEAIEEMIDPEDNQTLELIQGLKIQSREAIEDIRRLVYELRPPELDNLGLVDALRQSSNLISQGKVNIIFDIPKTIHSLPAAVEIAAYRIILEAINNVVRHANATEAIVYMHQSGDKLILSISDNGDGFKKDAKFGVGMNSMRERTEELDGRFEVDQGPQGGLRIKATFLLD